MLDNPFFTVNQRGQSSYNTAGMTVDRWNFTTPAILTFNSDGTIKLTHTSEDRSEYFVQRISDNLLTPIFGKDITASIMLQDGTVYSGTGTMPNQLTSTTYRVINYFSIGTTGFGIYVTVAKDNMSYIALGSDSVNKAINIRAIKLEVGSVSTIGLDTIPNYGLELVKCKVDTTILSDHYANQGDIAVTSQLSNRNLLDNPWFTINQRGQTTYEPPVGNNYCFDRWRTGVSSSLTQGEFKVVQNDDGSINLVNGSSVYCNFVQPLENDLVKRIHGKTVTLSIRFADDTVLYNSGVIDASIDASEIGVRVADGTQICVRCSGNMKAVIQISVKGEMTVSNIKAAKLELGTVSTLALDTAPNYAEELLKCQRYYIPINIGLNYAGIFNSSSQVKFTVPIPVKMRATPTLTGITKLGMSHQGGTFNTTSITAQSVNNNGTTGIGILCSFTIASGTPQTYGACTVQLQDTTGELSANL